MSSSHYPHGIECPGCLAEQERAARYYDRDSWTRVDSVRSYCLLAAAVLVACAVLVASFLVPGMP